MIFVSPIKSVTNYGTAWMTLKLYDCRDSQSKITPGEIYETQCTEDIFSDDRFLDSVPKSFLHQTTLDLRKKMWDFVNQDLPVPTL